MLTFLFWNVNQKPLQNLIAALVEEHRVDVLILAETEITDVGMLRALNPGGDSEFHLPPSFCPSIKIFTRFPREFLEQVSEGNRFSIRRLLLPGRPEVLLAAVHFPSKLRWSEDSQMLECTQLSATIIEVEAGAGHSRTVLVGDMNMNPFEKGIVAAAGFHGVMTRQIASRGERIVQDRRYQFFYNPMWSRLGDSPERPAGSYYYDASEHVNYYWNVFDQVLIRPELLDFFDNARLKILTEVQGSSLLRMDGQPDPKIASDHLPLLFSLDL